jgi:hypothetical protein
MDILFDCCGSNHISLCIYSILYTNVQWYDTEQCCFVTVKKKVKCTLVQAVRLCTGHMARRGSRGRALLFHDHGTRRGRGVSVTPWLLFTPGKGPVPIVQEDWVGPRAGLDRCGKSRPHWDSIILIHINAIMSCFDKPRIRDQFQTGKNTIILSKMSRPALRPTQAPTELVLGPLSTAVMQSGHKADHSPLSSAQVKNTSSYTSVSPYTFKP